MNHLTILLDTAVIEWKGFNNLTVNMVGSIKFLPLCVWWNSPFDKFPYMYIIGYL